MKRELAVLIRHLSPHAPRSLNGAEAPGGYGGMMTPEGGLVPAAPSSLAERLAAPGAVRRAEPCAA